MISLINKSFEIDAIQLLLPGTLSFCADACDTAELAEVVVVTTIVGALMLTLAMDEFTLFDVATDRLAFVGPMLMLINDAAAAVCCKCSSAAAAAFDCCCLSSFVCKIDAGVAL